MSLIMRRKLFPPPKTEPTSHERAERFVDEMMQAVGRNECTRIAPWRYTHMLRFMDVRQGQEFSWQLPDMLWIPITAKIVGMHETQMIQQMPPLRPVTGFIALDLAERLQIARYAITPETMVGVNGG